MMPIHYTPISSFFYFLSSLCEKFIFFFDIRRITECILNQRRPIRFTFCFSFHLSYFRICNKNWAQSYIFTSRITFVTYMHAGNIGIGNVEYQNHLIGRDWFASIKMKYTKQNRFRPHPTLCTEPFSSSVVRISTVS